MKCDKRTQNSAEFSENDSAEKHNKKHINTNILAVI